MPLRALIAALVAAGLGGILKRLIFFRWSRLYLYAEGAVFPKLCPVCLSPDASSTVEEKTTERQTRYYVVAQKLEWWKAPVPHCAACAAKLLRDRIVGFALGGVCAIAALLIAPPAEYSFVTLCYLLFGYPAYIVIVTYRKGVVFGRGTAKAMCIYVRHAAYLRALAALNQVGPAKM